jgi:dTDP-4-amino-4,6-dideoxygalactose transaminase
MIPFVDLKIQLDNLADDINLAMQNVLETSSFIRGPAIKEFEEDFASMMGASFVRGVGSGTDALHLAVRALGIGPGAPYSVKNLKVFFLIVSTQNKLANQSVINGQLSF